MKRSRVLVKLGFWFCDYCGKWHSPFVKVKGYTDGGSNWLCNKGLLRS